MSGVDLRELSRIRAADPGAIARAYRRRRRRPLTGEDGRLLLIAADHPARGALGAAGDELAMADRTDLLERLLVALRRPGVDGLLAAPDVVEDLLLLGALDGKVVIGSMNRGGLPGAVFEADDRFTGYDAEGIERFGLDGGKMLLRIDPDDPASVSTMQSCASAVTALAKHGLTAVVVTFMARRSGGRLRNELMADAVVRSAAIAAALGATSAFTWLKLPVVEHMDRVAAATSLPVVLLGGETSDDPEATYAAWREALALPTVRGLAVGRSMLYPSDGDVAGAVDTAAGLLGRNERKNA